MFSFEKLLRSTTAKSRASLTFTLFGVDHGAPTSHCGECMLYALHTLDVGCIHSRQISPYFEELARSYSGLRFLKVDVDKLNEVTAEAAVNAVPAFQVWKDGAVVDEFVGASKEDLRALCEKHQFEEGELEGDK